MLISVFVNFQLLAIIGNLNPHYWPQTTEADTGELAIPATPPRFVNLENACIPRVSAQNVVQNAPDS